MAMELPCSLIEQAWSRQSTLELVRTMKQREMYEDHQARALRLLSKIHYDMGLVAESHATMASALDLRDLGQDEQWNRSLRLLQTLNGSLGWLKSEWTRRLVS